MKKITTVLLMVFICGICKGQINCWVKDTSMRPYLISIYRDTCGCHEKYIESFPPKSIISPYGEEIFHYMDWPDDVLRSWIIPLPAFDIIQVDTSGNLVFPKSDLYDSLKQFVDSNQVDTSNSVDYEDYGVTQYVDTTISINPKRYKSKKKKGKIPKEDWIIIPLKSKD